MGLLDGMSDGLKRQFYRGGAQRPWDKQFVAQVVGVTPKGKDMAVVDVLIYTGDESPWQGPRKDSVRTTIPEGVQPRIGQRVVVGTAGGGTPMSNTPRPIFWDRPAPELPPMQLPSIPGGDDPNVMLEHLQRMVNSKALDREGFERAKRYLESGGWG